MHQFEFAPKKSGQAKSKAKERAQSAPVRLTVQMGTPGAEAVEAGRALIELGKRQKVGKRLGAEAVIKAERR